MAGPNEPRYITPVTQGGTGVTQLADNEIVLGNGRSPLKTTTDLPAGTTLGGNTILRTDTFTYSTYSGGSINIGTTNDGAYADVDATNAKLDFTVNVPGKYAIVFQFVHYFNGTAAATAVSGTQLRLTDGTNNSDNLCAYFSSGAATGAFGLETPVTLIWIATFTTTGVKTVKLQKQNTHSTNVAARSILASTTGGNGSIIMFAVRIAD